jgi:hypothetical protein
MSRKSEALMKSLADLLMKHSATDWEIVANRLEDLAAVARKLKEKSKPVKKPKLRASPRALQDSMDHLSPITREFLEYIRENYRRYPVRKLRALAIFMGIKTDPSSESATIIEVIYRHLEKLDEKRRLEKIRAAVIFLEGGSASQSDHYDRWVTLITGAKDPG